MMLTRLLSHTYRTPRPRVGARLTLPPTASMLPAGSDFLPTRHPVRLYLSGSGRAIVIRTGIENSHQNLMKLQHPMTTHTLRITALLTALMFLAPTMTTHGQLAEKPPEPRREQLLNGLKVLLWNRPGDAQVLLKLRIHSGAAFDLDGKEGLMALLGDALFPDSATRQYVTEDLGGKLVVSTD
ncbi:MAG: hypothetical protein M3R15_35405 [Acidobacteriota bacterium]|nr:hypothetical protein [Acidobacteriota bacterium]